jgi:divalent metal cation (Fe/Co/Zn/Cd) transporter
MRAYKVIVVIVLVMAIFTMFLVPMESEVFPEWLNTDLIEFMLMLFCVACAISLMR